MWVYHVFSSGYSQKVYPFENVLFCVELSFMNVSWFYSREITSFVNVTVICGFPQAVQVFLNQRIYHHLPKLGILKSVLKLLLIDCRGLSIILLDCEAVYPFTRLHGVTYQRAVTFITLFMFLHRPRSQMNRSFVFKDFSSSIRDYAKFTGTQTSVMPRWVCTCLHSG